MTELKEVQIQSLESDPNVRDYTIRQVECGYNHTLLLVDCQVAVPDPDDVFISDDSLIFQDAICDLEKPAFSQLRGSQYQPPPDYFEFDK